VREIPPYLGSSIVNELAFYILTELISGILPREMSTDLKIEYSELCSLATNHIFVKPTKTKGYHEKIRSNKRIFITNFFE